MALAASTKSRQSMAAIARTLVMQLLVVTRFAAWAWFSLC